MSETESPAQVAEEKQQQIVNLGQRIAAAMAETWTEQVTAGLEKDLYPCRLRIFSPEQLSQITEVISQRTVAAHLLTEESSKAEDIIDSSASRAVAELLSQLREMVNTAHAQGLLGDSSSWGDLRLVLLRGPEIFFAVRASGQDQLLEGYLVVRVWVARVAETPG